MAKPKFFQLFTDYDEMFDILSDEEAGQLIKGIFAFSNERDVPDFSDNKAVLMLYKMIAGQIQRDYDVYAEKCQKLKQNAVKRYEAANASNCREDKDKDKDEDKDEDEDEGEDKDNADLIVGKADSPALSRDEAENVIACYNRCCTGLPQAKRLSQKRLNLIRKAKELLRDISFEEYFTHVENSDFLTGRSGKWTGCGFDWLLREDNLIRVLEGSFDNRNPTPHPRSYDIQELARVNTLEEYN